MTNVAHDSSPTSLWHCLEEVDRPWLPWFRSGTRAGLCKAALAKGELVNVLTSEAERCWDEHMSSVSLPNNWFELQGWESPPFFALFSMASRGVFSVDAGKHKVSVSRQLVNASEKIV